MLRIASDARSPISFGAVKAVLRHYGLSSKVSDPRLAQSLRIIYPLDADLAARVRSSAVSLTDSARTREQIRFFQRQRARRSYIKLAEHITDRFGEVSVCLYDAQNLDQPSREFFELAARVTGWSVQMSFATFSQALSHAPDAEEESLLRELSSNSLGSRADEVCSLALEYASVGDAWSAIRLGQRLQAFSQSPGVWRLLAIAQAMLGNTLEAEFYYDRWASSGPVLERIRALYGKAMLYIRHHPAGLRDIDRGADLLNQAYNLIGSLKTKNYEEEAIVFDEVFNRNGFALVLFRRKKVEQAISLLKWGIDALKGASESVALHRTVLIYNLAQCFKQLGDLPAAIATYQRLLAVDPYMPEYHLETAKCLAATKDLKSAISQCKQAISLDDTLSSAWALLGVYEGREGNYRAAALAHRRAAILDPDSPSHLTDEVYNLILDKRLDEAAKCFGAWITDSLDQTETERRTSLEAEIYLRQGRPEKALGLIDETLLKYPDSEVLRQNRTAILKTSP